MAAKRFIQSKINWAEIAERVPEQQKPQYIAFKAKSDNYLRRVMAYPENPPKIDWTIYKNKIPIAGLVENFQKQYDSLKIPYPQDTTVSQLDALEKELNADVKKFISESNVRIEEYSKELTRLLSLLPFEQMTMEDYRDAYPDLAMDPINKPTFWPHGEDDQLGYVNKDAPQNEGH
uniref:ATP synthase subunit d, mitochondrial n=1 Tax=Clastoptera arizonana TaxID=38151 RepID=A0A1B6DLU4_9HEMI